jgi:hypothetical protein
VEGGEGGEEWKEGTREGGREEKEIRLVMSILISNESSSQSLLPPPSLLPILPPALAL